jgi:hypothetical protein
MKAITPQRQAEARKMLAGQERTQVEMLATDVERLINSRLGLGLSGEQVGAIAATVRTELRDQIDAAVYHQRSTAHQGMPPI